MTRRPAFWRYEPTERKKKTRAELEIEEAALIAQVYTLLSEAEVAEHLSHVELTEGVVSTRHQIAPPSPGAHLRFVRVVDTSPVRHQAERNGAGERT